MREKWITEEHGAMKKKLWAVCCICLLLGSLMFGCASQEKTTELMEYPVVLYFANSQYIETGEESVEPLVKTSGQVVCREGEQYESLLFMLREVPDSLKGAQTTITEKVQFKMIKVNEGTAYVDMDGDGLMGGSSEEGLLISQIVNSLRDSFREIEEVQFLVDGKMVESLMGHYDAVDPYTEGIYQ